MQDILRTNSPAAGQQGLHHRPAACDSRSLHRRDDGPFLREGELARAAQSDEPLHGFYRSCCGRLLADEPDGDADVGQGSGNLEQFGRHHSGKEHRLYPVEVARDPRADTADDREDIEQGIPDRYQSPRELRGLEPFQQRAQDTADRWFEYLVRLHETLRKLGGYLRTQNIGRVLLDECQLRGDTLRTPVVGRQGAQLVVVAHEHHGRIAADLAEDGLHICHRCPFAV